MNLKLISGTFYSAILLMSYASHVEAIEYDYPSKEVYDDILNHVGLIQSPAQITKIAEWQESIKGALKSQNDRFFETKREYVVAMNYLLSQYKSNDLQELKRAKKIKRENDALVDKIDARLRKDFKNHEKQSKAEQKAEIESKIKAIKSQNGSIIFAPVTEEAIDSVRLNVGAEENVSQLDKIQEWQNRTEASVKKNERFLEIKRENLAAMKVLLSRFKSNDLALLKRAKKIETENDSINRKIILRIEDQSQAQREAEIDTLKQAEDALSARKAVSADNQKGAERMVQYFDRRKSVQTGTDRSHASSESENPTSDSSGRSKDQFN